MTPDEPRPPADSGDPTDDPGPPSAAGRAALDGLRAIWAATGQGGPDLGLECAADERGCTANVGFDGLAGTVEPTDAGEAIDRLRRGWKATLAREGKLHEPG